MTLEKYKHQGIVALLMIRRQSNKSEGMRGQDSVVSGCRFQFS